ncbi:19708_t:CDS:2 [Entrophospora sp. SA101]|nr:19708_t:CDS:2 [Entrophospora sp. SA101]
MSPGLDNKGKSVRKNDRLISNELKLRRGSKIPEYKEINAFNFKPNPEFEFHVLINNEVYGRGTGSNTKNARKAAASNALEKIYSNESNYSDNPFINDTNTITCL